MNKNETLCGRITREELLLSGAQLVPAGSVNGGLSVCDYEEEAIRLPHTSIENQNYTEGYCPDGALAVGTLYPELTDIYK